MRRGALWLLATLASAYTASLVKIMGAVLYGSRALYIDGLTSAANMVAAAAGVYYAYISRRPPDLDHHYGHVRLGYGAIMVAVAAYSFVAGVGVSELMVVEPYSVSYGSVYAAVAGTLLYVVAIYSARRASGFLRAYSVFTWSEVLEGVVVAVSAYMGITVSYIIDYGGAVVILSYIFYEIMREIRDLIVELSDTAPPHTVYVEIKELLRENGLIPLGLRLRVVSPGIIHGDALVKASRENISVAEFAELVSRVREKALMHGVDLVVMPVM